MTQRAIILFAHGSRDPLWRGCMEAIAAKARAQAAGLLIDCAYLELCAPDLGQCFESIVAHGAEAVTIVPMFLGMGRHAREDLPGLVQKLRNRHPGIDVVVAQVIGENPAVIDLLARVVRE